MRQLIASEGGGTLKLDLSDEVQYRFLRGRMAATGKTPERYPQFFATLEKLRSRHQEQKSQVSAFADAAPRDHLVGDFVVLPGGTTFEATAFATIQGGADYNFVDVVVWNEDQTQQLSDYGWGEVFGDGRKLKARATGPMPFVGDDVFIVDSVNLISKGGVDEVYMTSQSVKPPPGGIVFHPKDSNKDGIVTICLDRNYGDCDYPMVGFRQVQIPLKGSITFPFRVTQILNTAQTHVKLVEESGGPREMAFGPFSNFLTINPNDPRQVLWDVPQSKGIFNGILFRPYEDVDFFLSIQVVMQRPSGPTTVTSKISSVRSATTPGMPSVPKHQIVYSCLAKGTQILMADGKTANIEKIAKGSKVVTDSSGVALSVADISVGIERIPMVRIQDDAGHELLMTRSHPVLTPDRGVVWAEELNVGSKVLTRSGTRTLVTVKRELYHDQVYNLKLDTSTLAQKSFPAGSSMYANGFLVGDLGLQKAHEFKNREDRTADVLRRLPSRWHKDYQSSLKVSAR
ncbi:MAG TPA: Hint domain-containing protein [Myxococcaceae bacterium]|nr:Hint domain-containing protein [Myxococcaceae bacterium]